MNSASAERSKSLLEIYPDINGEIIKQFEMAVRNGKDVTVPAVIFPGGHQIWLSFFAAISQLPDHQYDKIFVTSPQPESDSIARSIADFYRTNTRVVEIKTSDRKVSVS